MSRVFWDTSALMKLCKTEVGSELLLKKIHETPKPIFVSHLAIIEFNSVNYRRLRKGLQSLAELQKVQSILAEYYRLKRLSVVATSRRIMNAAEKLILQHGHARECQTYDAVHLATAIDLHQRFIIAEFVSADRGLLSLADLHGLPTLDPETA
jgi:predicted nucleic acid-binding protein